MGLSKIEKFTAEQNEMAKLAKALGHPARIAIIQFLVKTKSCVCGDIVDELPLSQSTVSQHLKELKTAGLIKGTIDGPSVCYCINDVTWQKAKAMLGDLFESYVSTNSCC
ncbi:winged helix-turn-helix transcriptional regulator [Fulvivirga sp. 29W222]|uniref:Winged helix-turn-helix transcriptional regulator n=1 Tax=Fulvivirga marina TaxID=2494733 RepID=A0A937G1J6_9BACT|nr:metalloregulator ArsR/SmtB family transcription factor [Fulvivirga marina]MBL6449954.1 winged helix-turn-helix transcriptional regulator [Fulvivirga marina]